MLPPPNSWEERRSRSQYKSTSNCAEVSALQGILIGMESSERTQVCVRWYFNQGADVWQNFNYVISSQPLDFPPKCQSTRIIPEKNKPYKINSVVTSSKCMMIFDDVNSCNIFQWYCQDKRYPPLRANNRSGPQEMPCPALSGANFNPTVTVPRQQSQRRTQQKIYENIWKFLISFQNLFISYHILSYWEKIFYPSPSPPQ